MNTQTYEKLLNELGIPFEWSLEDREALLETEFNKALDRINAIQQSGDMDKIKQLKEKADELGKAIDYTRELQKSLSSGIVLDKQSEKDRQKDTLKALKEAGKEKTQTLKELADVTQSATQSGNSSAGQSAMQPISNTSATQQPVSAINANPTLQSLMRRAEMEVDGANWEKAKELYDKILNADPKNVAANLGFFMANRQIREKKKIPEAARAAWKNNEDLFQDTYFLRARRYADAALKKEMDDMEKGRDYLLAIEEMQRAKTDEDYKKAAGMFANLGDFADAKTKRLEAGYKQADYALRQANRIEDFLAAKKLFEELGDYSDSKKKVQECERGIASIKDAAERKAKQLQKEKEENEKYEKDYEQFEKEVMGKAAIRACRTKIGTLEAKKKRLEGEKEGKVLKVKTIWFLITGVMWLYFTLWPAVVVKYLARVLPVSEYGMEQFTQIFGESLRLSIDDAGLLFGFFGYCIGVAILLGIGTAILSVPIYLIAKLLEKVTKGKVYADYFVPIEVCFIGGPRIILGGIILGIVQAISIATGFEQMIKLIANFSFGVVFVLKVIESFVKGNDQKRYQKIGAIKREIENEYKNLEREINTIVDSEYQKLLNKYPDATNADSTFTVQRRIKKKVEDSVKSDSGFGGRGGNGWKQWDFSFPKKFYFPKKLLPKLLAVMGIFYAIQFGLVTLMDAPSGWSVLAYAPNVLFTKARVENTPSPYFISLRPLENLYIGGGCEKLSKIIAPFGIKQVTLNCEEIKKITIPNSVTDLTLNRLKDEAASEIVLPKDLENLKITDSPNLTEEGFSALEIPESVKSLSLGQGLYYGGFSIVGENLKSINISNDLESLEVYAPGDFTANVNGDVQTFNIFSTGNLTVNVNGDVQKFDIGGEGTFAMHINGYVQGVNFGSGSFSGIENLTVDGTGRIDRMDLGYAGNGLQFNLVPKAMRVFSYSDENELILPEGIEILECGNYKGLQIPGSMRLLRAVSDTLDFDALNIPEGILYYKLDSDEREDHREYRAENCPQELVDFNFDSEDVTMPDLEGY